MKKYNFRLERLLKIKEHKEKIAEENYARELQKKIIFEQENRSMEKLMEENELSEFDSLKSGDRIDFEYFHQNERYIRSLELKIYDNNIKKDQLEPVISDLKEKLVEATREKKILEKLKEKDYLKYKEEKRKHDTKFMDEMASIMQLKKMEG